MPSRYDLDLAASLSTPSSSSPQLTTNKRKFPSILATVIDTRNVDLRSIDTWLEGFLKLECQPYDKLIGALVIDYLRAHRTPDGKVIQIELIDLGLIELTTIEKLMNKLWTRLGRDQEKYLNRHHDKKQRLSTTHSGDPPSRLGTSSTMSHDDSQCFERETTIYHHKNQIYHYSSVKASNGGNGGAGDDPSHTIIGHEHRSEDAFLSLPNPTYPHPSGRWYDYSYISKKEKASKEIMIESYT